MSLISLQLLIVMFVSLRHLYYMYYIMSVVVICIRGEVKYGETVDTYISYIVGRVMSCSDKWGTLMVSSDVELRDKLVKLLHSYCVPITTSHYRARYSRYEIRLCYIDLFAT